MWSPAETPRGHAHFKHYRDGTHRSVSPEETFERIREFLPVFGITRVANVTGLDDIGIPVVMAVRPNSRSLSVSQGKGASLAAAKVSAAMEAIEAYHAETLDISTRLLSCEEMAGRHETAELDGLGRNHFKPLPPDRKIPWVLGRELLTDLPIWVPYEVVHSDSTHPFPFDAGYFISDSNGLASGNCATEAMVHGICEVIERDALTLWSLKTKAEKNAQRVDPASVDDAACRDLIEKFISRDIQLAIWDITTEMGAPTYVCKIVQAGIGAVGIRPAMGAGCHLCKEVALSRALTEAAQSRLTFISGARDDQTWDMYRQALAAPRRLPQSDDIKSTSALIDFRLRRNVVTDFIEDDLAWLLARLRAAHIRQVVAIDLTQDRFGIAVVKILIPHLEHHSAPERRIMGRRALSVLAARPKQS